MDLLRAVLLLALLVALAACQMDDRFKGSNAKKTYCGKHLAQTLSTVCKGNYNTLNKYSDIYSPGSFWPAEYAPVGQIEYPYRSKASASSLMTTFRRRKRRGVFNECCEKACSVEELSSYCGNTQKE